MFLIYHIVKKNLGKGEEQEILKKPRSEHDFCKITQDLITGIKRGSDRCNQDGYLHGELGT